MVNSPGRLVRWRRYKILKRPPVPSFIGICECAGRWSSLRTGGRDPGGSVEDFLPTEGERKRAVKDPSQGGSGFPKSGYRFTRIAKGKKWPILFGGAVCLQARKHLCMRLQEEGRTLRRVLRRRGDRSAEEKEGNQRARDIANTNMDLQKKGLSSTSSV